MSLQERQRFAKRLVAVLDYADRRSSDWDADEGPWEEFWQLARSLLYDPEKTPIAIIDGKLVERDLQSFTPATRVRMISARRRRRAGDGVA